MDSGIFYVGIGSVLTAFVFYFVNILNKNPETLPLSILGIQGSGKTVYLTVLFNQLQQAKGKGVKFSPCDHGTTKKVGANLNVLASGRWLPPTKPRTISYYRAAINHKGEKIKVEIADYAGEHLNEFDSSDEMWLHKSDFFNYVTRSEGLMLVMDVEYILRESPANVEKMQSAYVATIQILVEKKGRGRQKKLNIPVTLLFAKSDLLSSDALRKSDIYDTPRLRS